MIAFALTSILYNINIWAIIDHLIMYREESHDVCSSFWSFSLQVIAMYLGIVQGIRVIALVYHDHVMSR